MKESMKIAVYAFKGATMFHLSTPQLVFDEVARQGLADWNTVLFSEQAGSIRTAEGYDIGGIHGEDAAAEADIVVVPSWADDGRDLSPTLRRTLVAAHKRGSVVVGLWSVLTTILTSAPSR